MTDVSQGLSMRR